MRSETETDWADDGFGIPVADRVLRLPSFAQIIAAEC